MIDWNEIDILIHELEENYKSVFLSKKEETNGN